MRRRSMPRPGSTEPCPRMTRSVPSVPRWRRSPPWRAPPAPPPGDPASRSWEERFGEPRSLSLGVEAWTDALAASGLQPSDVDLLVVCGTHDRAVAGVVKKTGLAPDRVVDRLASTVGNTGAAQ